jgi:hypothetical protein
MLCAEHAAMETVCRHQEEELAMTTTKTDRTKSTTSRLTKGCVVKTGSGYRAEQGSVPGVSAEAIGSQMIWFGKVTIPPDGARKRTFTRAMNRRSFC